MTRSGRNIRFICTSSVNHLEESFVPRSRYIYLASSRRQRQSLDLKLTLKQGIREIQTEALVDCGAYSSFAHYRFVQEHGLELCCLSREIRVFNADATENKKGLITHYTRCMVTIGDHTSWQSFLVTDIGNRDIIIGMTFLREHNPEIDWKAGQVKFTRCPTTCHPKQFLAHEEEVQAIDKPRLEEFAQDNYGQLEPGPWDRTD